MHFGQHVGSDEGSKVFEGTWGERARQELRATAHRRGSAAWDRLTTQELQIAQLAAAGASNREIGQRRSVSHRTVSTHLSWIFPKLGITSRPSWRRRWQRGPPAQG